MYRSVFTSSWLWSNRAWRVSLGCVCQDSDTYGGSTTTGGLLHLSKRAGFERSRRELSLDVSVGVHILLVVEQSGLESQSRGCAKTPILPSDQQ